MANYAELEARKKRLEEIIEDLKADIQNTKDKKRRIELIQQLIVAEEEREEVIRQMEEKRPASLNELKMEVFKCRNLIENLREKVESGYKSFYSENGKSCGTLSSTNSTNAEINGVPPSQDINVDAALTKNI